MPLSTLPLGSKPYTTPYTNIGRERCENLYLEATNSTDTKVAWYLVSTPGMELITSATAGSVCRGLYTGSNGLTYGVYGNKFIEISSQGARIQRGVLQTQQGTVKFADNGLDMIIVDGSAGYHFQFVDNSFAVITDSYFPGVGEESNAPTHVVCIDSYFIVNEPGTNKYYWSTPNYIEEAFNPDTPNIKNRWNGLYFGVKAGSPDNILALEKIGNNLFVIGRQSVEVHYNTGDYTSQLWQRLNNVVINVGTLSPFSVSVHNNVLLWLGRDNTGMVGVYAIDSSYQPKKVSTIGIDTYISTIENYDNCIAFAYSQKSHSFIVFQFIDVDNGKTLVYDLTTDAWHERTYLDELGKTSNWKGMYSTYNYKTVFVGHKDCNAIYSINSEKFDNDEPYMDGVSYIQRLKTTPIISSNGVNIRYNSAQFVCQQGVGLNANNIDYVGKNPILMIRISNDGGVSWTGVKYNVEIGKIGETDKRTKLVRLGTARNRVFEISCTDPVELVLLNVIIDATPYTR